MGKNERPTVLESLARAVHSDDLSHRPTLCPVDYIHGLGMVGQRDRQGTALLDLHMTLEPDAAREAMRVALEITHQAARRRNWSMPALKARRIAGEALALYLRPACTCCKGRGMLGTELNPAESSVTCQSCKGSGEVVRRGKKHGGVVYRPGPEGTKVPTTCSCPDCGGKGRLAKAKQVEPHRPRPCHTCGGSGKRPVPLKHRREITEVLYVMETRLNSAMQGVKRVMRTSAPAE